MHVTMNLALVGRAWRGFKHATPSVVMHMVKTSNRDSVVWPIASRHMKTVQTNAFILIHRLRVFEFPTDKIVFLSPCVVEETLDLRLNLM